MRKFSRLGLTIRVYDNRVEIGDGMWPFRKKTIIPFQSIASVEVSKFTKQLVIMTNDSKTRKYAIGGFGKAQKCRDAISENL